MMAIKPKIGEILFATDLSECAEHAFTYAAAMAEAFDARITVLHVIGKMPPNAELLLVSFLGYLDANKLRQKSEAELIVALKERLKRFCAETSDRIVECRFALDDVIVESGRASERILHHASTGRYDALVLGSRGHGLVREALTGGTSRKVVLSSPIPVFVIPMVRAGLDAEKE